MMAGELCHNLPGEFGKKGEVVVCVNDERLFAGSCELVEVHHRTGGEPQLSQPFEIDLLLHALANVPGRLAVPHDVGEISGGVVEGRNPDARVVSASDESVTGTKTRADQAELPITLLLQPIETTTNVDDTLAYGIQ